MAAHRRGMTPDERVKIAASMYERGTRRSFSLSLPPGLSRRERRMALARRFYEGEAPRGRRWSLMRSGRGSARVVTTRCQAMRLSALSSKAGHLPGARHISHPGASGSRARH